MVHLAATGTTTEFNQVFMKEHTVYPHIWHYDTDITNAAEG